MVAVPRAIAVHSLVIDITAAHARTSMTATLRLQSLPPMRTGTKKELAICHGDRPSFPPPPVPGRSSWAQPIADRLRPYFFAGTLFSESSGRQNANGRAMPGHSISRKNLEL
jgi:hypothetical protein